MCQYVTLVAPTDDQDGLSRVLARFGRCAVPMSNPSIEKVLQAGEHQFLTRSTDCDCGTVLGGGCTSAAEASASLAAMRRKGWSQAKIDRALASRQKAAARPKATAKDSFDVWAELISASLADLNLGYVGLLVHTYRGELDEEEFRLSRRPAPVDLTIRTSLAGLAEDELVTFNAAGQAT